MKIYLDMKSSCINQLQEELRECLIGLIIVVLVVNSNCTWRAIMKIQVDDLT